MRIPTLAESFDVLGDMLNEPYSPTNTPERPDVEAWHRAANAAVERGDAVALTELLRSEFPVALVQGFVHASLAVDAVIREFPRDEVRRRAQTAMVNISWCNIVVAIGEQRSMLVEPHALEPLAYTPTRPQPSLSGELAGSRIIDKALCTELIVGFRGMAGAAEHAWEVFFDVVNVSMRQTQERVHGMFEPLVGAAACVGAWPFGPRCVEPVAPMQA